MIEYNNKFPNVLDKARVAQFRLDSLNEVYDLNPKDVSHTNPNLLSSFTDIETTLIRTWQFTDNISQTR